MLHANALVLKEVHAEVTSMSPVFRDDRLSVQRVMQSLHKDARKGRVPYGFINQLKRELKKLGFDL